MRTVDLGTLSVATILHFHFCYRFGSALNYVPCVPSRPTCLTCLRAFAS